MQEESIPTLYSKGFSLVNKCLELYLIYLVWSSPQLFRSFFSTQPFSGIFSIVSLVLLAFQWGFSLSLPLFFLKRENNALSFGYIFSTTLQNTKRVILPGVLLILLFIGFMIISVFAIVILFHQTREQIVQGVASLGHGWQPILLIPSVIASFFVFTPVLFSLENKGLFSAFGASIKLGFKNLPYLITIMLAGMFAYSITFFLPAKDLGLLLRSVITFYIGFVVSATTYLYYQKRLRSIS